MQFYFFSLIILYYALFRRNFQSNFIAMCNHSLRISNGRERKIAHEPFSNRFMIWLEVFVARLLATFLMWNFLQLVFKIAQRLDAIELWYFTSGMCRWFWHREQITSQLIHAQIICKSIWSFNQISLPNLIKIDGTRFCNLSVRLYFFFIQIFLFERRRKKIKNRFATR